MYIHTSDTGDSRHCHGQTDAW